MVHWNQSNGRLIPNRHNHLTDFSFASTVLAIKGLEMSVTPDKLADMRLKHLEMVQSIIARIANYGATLKNYSLTLTTAICGFSITLQRPSVAILALLPVVLFATLDVQYLRTERRFRALFDKIRLEDWSTQTDARVDIKDIPGEHYCKLFFSWSIVYFYLPLAICIIAVAYLGGHTCDKHI